MGKRTKLITIVIIVIIMFSCAAAIIINRANAQNINFEFTEVISVEGEDGPEYSTTLILKGVKNVQGYQIKIDSTIPGYQVSVKNRVGAGTKNVYRDGNIYAGAIDMEGKKGDVEILDLVLQHTVEYDQETEEEIEPTLMEISELPEVKIIELQVVDDILKEEISTYGDEEQPFANVNFSDIKSSSNTWQ